jgi:prophage regulatory protein
MGATDTQKDQSPRSFQGLKGDWRLPLREQKPSGEDDFHSTQDSGCTCLAAAVAYSSGYHRKKAMLSIPRYEALLRLPAVLARLPVSRAHFYARVKSGEYPAPIKLGARSVAWRSSDIEALIARLIEQGTAK